MKRKTILALAMAGALACGTSSAATFLCTQDEANGSSISCAEIPSEVLGSMASREDVWVPSPPFITYYLVPSEQDEVALMEFVEPSESALVTYYLVEPISSAQTDLSAADQWQHSEPRTVTYMSSAEFDAMNPGGSD